MLYRSIAHIQRRALKRVGRVTEQRTHSGQALVEFTLALTLLTYLFAAAVDLGFAYKSYQTLLNASAEASSYLTVMPAMSPCSGCTPQQAWDASDSEARRRFRGEQGFTMRAFGGSTMDLDSNGQDDETQGSFSGFSNFEAFIQAKVKINEADSTQIIVGSDDFGIGGSFAGTSDSNCLQRKRFSTSGGQCYIVIQSEIEYRPFAISPFVGNRMVIRAISVKPIVQG